MSHLLPFNGRNGNFSARIEEKERQTFRRRLITKHVRENREKEVPASHRYDTSTKERETLLTSYIYICCILRYVKYRLLPSPASSILTYFLIILDVLLN